MVFCSLNRNFEVQIKSYMQDFIHLHVHTYYSILDGMSSIEKLVDKAIADGQRGMAITDHGNMFGIKDFSDYCEKVNKKLVKEGKEPFKPIIGCEMYVARNGDKEEKHAKSDIGGYHLIVLAKNLTGYKNLVKLVSRAWVDGFYMRPRTDRKDLERYHEGLIVCSACIAGEVPHKILEDDIAGAREAIEWYRRVFGEDYYLELQRHEVTDPDIRANRETFPLQQKANKVLIELAKEYGIKLICTNDAHFVDRENAEAHDHLLCLATAKDLDDPSRMLYSKQEWLKTREEMSQIFSDIPETLANTMEILDKVEVYSLNHDPIMPFFPIPEEFGTEEDVRRRYTEKQLYDEFTSDENGKNQLSPEEGEKRIAHLGGYDRIYRIKFEAEYLGKLAYDGAKKLYGEPLSDEVKERINFELHVMKTMGFPGYFLIVQDFINTARNELDVLVGPGRGSAAGSVVAYCLGITQIDPLKYDLLFERFLNPDRISLPDIDTDFDDDGRGRVLKWVEEKYGHERVAHIITYSTMATKNSIKDVARVEKLPLSESDRLCKLIPKRLGEDPETKKELKINLPNVIKCIREFRDAELSTDPKLSNTIKYAKMLEGTVRGTGIHACGTIICRDDISDWVPVSTAEDPDNKGEKVLCTQYDGHVIENTGLIKMDFLGLKTLSELKDAVQNIKLTRGIDIDLEKIPIDDPATYQLYQEGRTVGTFQFESAGMQKYLRELHPTVFEDLIAMNALYRPGPMDYIPDFIKRKNNPSLVTYDIPCMEKYLKETYGITVYQEQVMLLSRQLANFTRGQSDSLRKAMGKKKIDEMQKLEKLFYEGGEKNGHDKAKLEKIWEDWKKFASYAFNKSHATCYSWVAFQTAYLKANYPAEFMAAIMSRRKNDISEVTKLMDECKAMNIHTYGPDVNESYMQFGVNKKGEIRFGLAAIKGVGEAAAQSIIAEREENGAFKDIYDFVQRINLSNVNRKCLENLILSGSFDSFGISRESFYGLNQKGELFLDLLVRYGQRYQMEQRQAKNSLFGDDEVEIARPKIPEVEPWSTIDRLNKERELVGIYLSAHPLDEYRFILEKMCNVGCDELKREMDWEKISKMPELRFGGTVTGIREGMSKKNDPYGIVTIEDFNGSGELGIFGDDWMKWRGSIIPDSNIFVKAACFERYKGSKKYGIVVTSINSLQTVKEKQIQKITITMDATSVGEDTVEELAKNFAEHPGKTEVYLRLFDRAKNQEITVRSQNSYILVSNELLSLIAENEGADYKIN